jgi:lysyl endopeptidase
MKLCLSLLTVLLIIVSCQIHENSKPLSFSLPLKRRSEVIQLPTLNHETLLKEDQETNKWTPLLKNNPRFGIAQTVDINLTNSGFWEEIKNEGRLWRLKIVSKDAFYTNLIFSIFKIPFGAKLWVYNDDRSVVLGSFTSRNNKLNGKFSTSPLRGDSFWIEYFEPLNFLGYGEISLKKVIHGYKDIYSMNISGECNINVKCGIARKYEKSSRSVVTLMTSEGTKFCTGTLINNLQKDSRQLLLTASHCLNPEFKDDVHTWIAVFQYESTECQRNVGYHLNFTASGMKLLSQKTSTDLLLLEIVEPIPKEYNAYLSGFNAEEILKSRYVYGIHHPSGDIKKFSKSSIPLSSFNYQDSSNSHWKVNKWENGTTEPGSSGSALFNDNEEIIGQLTGGSASCYNKDGFDIYGKLSLSIQIDKSLSEHLKTSNVLKVGGMELIPSKNEENCKYSCSFFNNSECEKKCK